MVDLQTVTLATRGMHCTACSTLIEMKLKKVEGVREVTSDHVSQETKISYDPTKTDLDTIFAVIKEAGYEPSLIE